MKAQVIGDFLGARIEGPDIDISHSASLANAVPGALAFLSKITPENISAFEKLQGCLILVPAAVEGLENPGCTLVRVDNPRLDFAKATTRFFTESVQFGIAATAQVHPTATIGPEVNIGHFAVVGPGVTIGRGTSIGDHAVVKNATIGQGCSIKSHAVIGEEGFGFDFEPDGTPVRVPHSGRVVIEDHVEVGSFTTVIRGTLDNTILRRNVKVDDHVHIAHNAQLDECTLVVACAEISGNVRLGKRCWIAPNASIINGIAIGDDVMVGMGSVVNRPVESNAIVAGVPAKFIRRRIADK